jgi:hypothetical protein
MFCRDLAPQVGRIWIDLRADLALLRNPKAGRRFTSDRGKRGAQGLGSGTDASGPQRWSVKTVARSEGGAGHVVGAGIGGLLTYSGDEPDSPYVPRLGVGQWA